MNQSHKSYQLQLVFALAMVAFATMGCFFFQPAIGDVFSNITTDLGGIPPAPSTPEGVAQIWLEALFNADAQTLRDNTCDSQRTAITDDMIRAMDEALNDSGATVNLGNLTYTFDETTNSITVDGEIEITVSDVTQDISASNMFPSFPMVKENDRWMVCPIR